MGLGGLGQRLRPQSAGRPTPPTKARSSPIPHYYYMIKITEPNQEILYFLEISLHLEILPPLKCRRIYLPTHPNATIEISLHGKGSTAISVCACTFYVHTNRLIIETVCTLISVDAALELLPHQMEP